MLKISKATITHLTRRQWARLWGQKHMIEPAFINRALGAGDFLMGLTPLNTRPSYYLIRIDARWWNPNGQNPEEFYDRLDDIYEAIEEECGSKDTEDDDGEPITLEWPALDLDCGCSWWDASDMLQARKKK
jgi:hypothetical protein